MADSRTPGPLGLHPQAQDLNDGTMIRALSSRPGPIGRPPVAINPEAIEMEVTIHTLHKGNIGFKAAGYQLWSVAGYTSSATNTTDWSGLYIATEAETAKGYLPDMVCSPGTGTAYIHKVTLTEDVKIIACMDDSFKRGNTDMAALRRALRKKFVDVRDADLLMPTLGSWGYFFKCYNNEEGAIEIIVPNNMVDKLVMNKYWQFQIVRYEVKKGIRI